MFLAPIAGFIGGDIKYQELDSGKKIARFRLGSNDRYRNHNGEFVERETVWVTCQAWGDLAERIYQEFSKGTPVVALGRWEQSNYEKDGVQKSTRFITVENIGRDLAVPSRMHTKPTTTEEPAQVTETESPVSDDESKENPL